MSEIYETCAKELDLHMESLQYLIKAKDLSPVTNPTEFEDA